MWILLGMHAFVDKEKTTTNKTSITCFFNKELNLSFIHVLFGWLVGWVGRGGRMM
jgi:hypothetical protein